MDEFSLAPDPLVSPLDIGQFGGTPPLQPPRPGAPQMPTMGQRGGGMQDAAPLLMLLPLIAKGGGRSAIAAFLRGMQKSRATQMTEQRVSNQDRRADAQQESLDAHRRALEEQARLRNQQQFRTQFATGLSGLEDDEAIRAYLDLLGPQGEALGIPRGDLDAFAMQTQKPSTLQKRAAEKRIAALKGQFGQDKWMQEGAKFLHEVGGERVPFEELLRRAGMVPDPQAPAQAPSSAIALDVPLDRQHAAALASGNTALAKQIEASITAQDAARRDPRDPVLAEIAAMRRDQMRNAPQVPPAVMRRVDSKARAFDALPIVKTVQKQAEAVSFANSLDPNTTNPADDQALIYAFAKAMDPDSVVREGEYATVQKYAQSWAERFGFNATRIFSNTQFLTADARQNMKATIQKRYQAGKAQYDNVRRSFARQINKITGQQDGEDFLTDYGAAFPSEPAQTAPGTVPPNPYRPPQ